MRKPLIQWRDEFSVGIADVDQEHQELIALINTLHAAVESGQEAVQDFLGEIFARISAHFALEEKIMRERHYDQFQEHKADHERLLDVLRDIMDRFEDDSGFDEQELAICLEAWFSDHFRNQDARLHQHLG